MRQTMTMRGDAGAWLALMMALTLTLALTAPACRAQAADGCGAPLSIDGHDRSSTRYAYRPPAPSAAPVTLLLLAGASGYVDLDGRGCARRLKGNWLVRAAALFGAAGLGTALVDAPSDYHGAEGLEGFRLDPRHADDLGRIVLALRQRSGGAVWLVGTSRGTISAVNAAARLTGPSAPDGVVLSSALMSPGDGKRTSWSAQTVFDVALEHIRQPLLLLGQEEDRCPRSPPGLMGQLAARIPSVRKQVVTVTGGPGFSGPPERACEGREPHGYVGQEEDVVSGVARFVRGARY